MGKIILIHILLIAMLALLAIGFMAMRANYLMWKEGRQKKTTLKQLELNHETMKARIDRLVSQLGELKNQTTLRVGEEVPAHLLFDGHDPRESVTASDAIKAILESQGLELGIKYAAPKTLTVSKKKEA